MAPEGDDLRDTTPIDFRFSTFGELARAFGEKRARALVRAVRRSDPGGAQTPGPGDVEMALRVLRGESSGSGARRALRAFGAYFAENEKARMACKTYLENLLKERSSPVEALECEYRSQVEALSRARRALADLLTFQKRMQLQQSELRDVSVKARSQGRMAQEQGREGLSHEAFLRAERAEQEDAGVAHRIEQIRGEQQELEVAVRKLQEKAEVVRTQREALRAQEAVASAWAQMEPTPDRRTGHTRNPPPKKRRFGHLHA